MVMDKEEGHIGHKCIMKYIFEENESEYMKLFHTTSPINGLPKYKLKTVKLLDEINIQEQK